jgi:hypothetical protein
VKGETLMEHETASEQFERTKRSLTAIAAGSGVLFVLSAIGRVLISLGPSPSHPLASLFGLGMILGLLVSLLGLNARLQVQMDESEETFEATGH